MENDFSCLVKMIKSVTTEDSELFVVREYGGEFLCVRATQGVLRESIVLDRVNKDTVCQDLHDCLLNEFGEQLSPVHTHDLDGDYEYFMALGDNIMIKFPSGYEYRNWTYNQVQEDMKKQGKKIGKSM